MAELKDAFNAISPIPWSSVPHDDLPTFLHEAYVHAEILANSVPISPSHPNASSTSSTTAPSRANTATEGLETLTTGHPTSVDTRNAAAQAHWGKPIKLSAKDNPLHVSVYKTAAQDRHGAWFARRSTHIGLGFKRWRKAMEREFSESLKIQDGPGSGAVRGIAGDKRLERRLVGDLGKVEVWQLSSVFPGPVTPRGFFSLILTSDNALSEASSIAEEASPENIPRHFIIISRPTTHEDGVPNRSLVYGTYQSVELVREVPENHEDPEMNPVEWIMITRSDPGGGIPKFMVERGTPGSIVADVPKFLDWAIKLDDTSELEEDTADTEMEKDMTSEVNHEEARIAEQSSSNDHTRDLQSTAEHQATTHSPHEVEHPTSPSNSTILGNLKSAVSATVSGYLPNLHLPGSFPITPANDTAEDPEEETASVSSPASSASSSSAGTFASAPELRSTTTDSYVAASRPSPPISLDSRKVHEAATDSKPSNTNAHDKELQKLGERRIALDARLGKLRAEDAKRAQELHDKEEQETTKAVEKREKERQKMEERFKREIEKVEERRVKEEKKAEDARVKEERRANERQKKAMDKDALLKTQRERDEAREKLEMMTRQNDLMTAQIEELQRQNNSLVQKMAAMGESGMDAARAIKEQSDKTPRTSSSNRSATGSSHKSKDSKEKADLARDQA